MQGGPSLHSSTPNDWVNAILESDNDILLSGKISTLFDKNPNIEILDEDELNYYLGANNSLNHGVLSDGSWNIVRVRDTVTKGLFVNNNKIVNAEYLQLNVKFSSAYEDSSTWGWQGLFADCTRLKHGPILMNLTPRMGEYSSCFAGCTSLEDAPTLPALTLPSACYRAMFWGCTSLKELPILPATTIGEWSYAYMFYYYDWQSGETGISMTATQTSETPYPFKFPTNVTSVSVHEDPADFMCYNYNSPQPDTVYYTSIPTKSQ